jgi:uncharacterized membrane protein YtjA (UPF0391 family)
MTKKRNPAWHNFFMSWDITLKLYLMLRWAAIFFVIAIVAAIFGFTGIAAGAASIAKILFFVFLVLFLLAIIGGTLLVKKK